MVNFEQISRLFLVFILLTLSMCLFMGTSFPVGKYLWKANIGDTTTMFIKICIVEFEQLDFPPDCIIYRSRCNKQKH